MSRSRRGYTQARFVKKEEEGEEEEEFQRRRYPGNNIMAARTNAGRESAR
jgi:hypothetical protein